MAEHGLLHRGYWWTGIACGQEPWQVQLCGQLYRGMCRLRICRCRVWCRVLLRILSWTGLGLSPCWRLQYGVRRQRERILRRGEPAQYLCLACELVVRLCLVIRVGLAFGRLDHLERSSDSDRSDRAACDWDVRVCELLHGIDNRSSSQRQDGGLGRHDTEQMRYGLCRIHVLWRRVRARVLLRQFAGSGKRQCHRWQVHHDVHGEPVTILWRPRQALVVSVQ